MLPGAACADAEQHTLAFAASGSLQDGTIREASGLARSQRQSGVLWIINDNGARERVHAIDHSGKRLGEFLVKPATNTDWEDLASFRLDDIPYLMIADIGDNDAKHAHRTLYFVREPTANKNDTAPLDWRVDFRYPDGSRDAESAAVDVETERALILSKRDRPPMLYAVPLQTESDAPVTATKLGAVTSLTQPTLQDLMSAPLKNDWYWQPVGMDISQDGLAAVILTYRAVFYYERRADQDWLTALNSTPIRIDLGGFENAEAVAFGDNNRFIVVTGENENSMVLGVDVQGERNDGQ